MIATSVSTQPYTFVAIDIAKQVHDVLVECQGSPKFPQVWSSKIPHLIT